MTVFMCTRNTLESIRSKNSTVNNGKNYLLYISGNLSKSVNGVGIKIESNRQIEFEPMSVRITAQKMTFSMEYL